MSKTNGTAIVAGAHAPKPTLPRMRRRGVVWIDNEHFTYAGSGEIYSTVDPQLVQHIATRSRSLDFMGMAGWLPNPDPVLRKAGKNIQVYADLMTDAHVAGAVQSRKAATLKLEWALDREGALDIIAADAVERVIRSLHTRRILSDGLNAPPYGYSVQEVIWAWTPEGWLMPRDVIGKPAHWFRFDPEGRLRLITNDDIEGKIVPPRKFLVAQHNASYDNPYGEAVLSRCYWPVTFKRGGIKFLLTFVERFGLPWVIGHYPRSYSDDQAQDFLDKMAAMTQDGVFALPDDARAEILANGFQGNSNLFADLLAWCNSEISKAILGHTGSIDSTPGKLGSETAAIGARADFADADKQLGEALFNQLIDWIYELNFTTPPEERVRYTLHEEEDVDLNLANRDKVLYDSGVRFYKEYYAANYGLQPEHFELSAPPEPPVDPNAPDGGGIPALGISAPPALPSGPLGTQQVIPGLFAEAPPRPGEAVSVERFPDQQAIEAIAGQIPAERLQSMMEPAVESIMGMISGATSFDDALGKLAALYPELDTGTLEQTLGSIFLLGETAGRTGVDEEVAE